MLHLDAGKYALFLWPAYGLSAVVLAGLTLQTLVQARRRRREAEAREAQRGPSADAK
jgi:heme exporter protein D